MIDTHVHILPGLDDGTKDSPEALALAQMLVEQGVSMVIATPHWNDDYPRLSVDVLYEQVARLAVQLEHAQIPLRVFVGNEILIQPGLIQAVAKGQVATLHGSRYILIELFMHGWLPRLHDALQELRRSGLVPIIAHPERYQAIQKQPNLLFELKESGVLLQGTLESLLEPRSSKARELVTWAIKQNLLYCLASDAHGVVYRPPRFSEALVLLRRYLKPTEIATLLEEHPAAIIANAPVYRSQFARRAW